MKIKCLIIFVCLFLIGDSCKSNIKRKQEMDSTTKEVSKISYTWEGTAAGLMPILTDGDPESILSTTENIIPELIKMLDEESLFVNAHILLTTVSKVKYQSFPEWNGLKVVIAADGKVFIDPTQGQALKKRWKKWYKTNPHPDELPEID